MDNKGKIVMAIIVSCTCTYIIILPILIQKSVYSSDLLVCIPQEKNVTIHCSSEWYSHPDQENYCSVPRNMTLNVTVNIANEAGFLSSKHVYTGEKIEILYINNTIIDVMAKAYEGKIMHASILCIKQFFFKLNAFF